MQIEIYTRNFSLTQSLRSHIERRLGFALRTRYDRIRRILVRLSDVNGPRGGNDKRCQIQLSLPGRPMLSSKISSPIYTRRSAGQLIARAEQLRVDSGEDATIIKIVCYHWPVIHHPRVQSKSMQWLGERI